MGPKTGSSIISGDERGATQVLLDALETGFAAIRGVGWEWETDTRTRAPPANYPRGRFIFEHISWIVVEVLMVDAVSVYIRTTPVGKFPSQERLVDAPLYLGCFRAVLLFLQSRWYMDLLYRCSAVIGMAIWNPSLFPPLFGSWREAYTVRRFWGYTWHQMMRSLAQYPVNALASGLRIRRGSYLSNYFKVSGSFFITYAMHGYGTHVAGGNHMSDFWWCFWQVAAIFVEERVIEIGQRLGIKESGATWAAGYAWNALVMALTCRLWIDEGASMGAYAKPPLGFSPLNVVLVTFGLAKTTRT